MNEHWLKAKNWWATLADREQKALMIGGLVVSLAVLYAGIWSPYLSHIEHLRQQIKSDQKTLAYIQAIDHKIQQSEKSAKPKRRALTSIDLLTEVQKKVEQAGLQQAMIPLKQSSQDTLDLHFQHVEFDKLIQLMMQLTQSYQVTITQFSTKKEPSPGIVSADFRLKRD